MIDELFTDNKRIPDLLAESGLRDLARLAAGSCEEPARVQELVLKQIIDIARDTEFGRQHNFESIQNSLDFQRRVPIREWPDFEPYSDRMANGEKDLLFPGAPECFVATSGTTGTKPKLIPESRPGAVARNTVMNLRLIALNRHFPGLLQSGCILPLSNATRGAKTASGIPVQYASGLTLNQSLQGGSAIRTAFPMAIFEVAENRSRDYLLMRFAIQQPDVVMIAGNNAGRIRELANFADGASHDIILDIERGTVDGAGIDDPAQRERLLSGVRPDPARAAELRLIKQTGGRILPRDYWPSLQLLAFWLSASVGHYIKDIVPMMPEGARYMDMGYGASEGKFNVPSEPGKAAGVLSLLTAFYEFIPESGGTPLLAHELKDQASYRLVITTWSGLYRYNLMDMVKVQGFTGKTPNIVFQYKMGEILNIADEKVPAGAVNDSIREVAQSLGIDPVQVQVFADEKERRYQCYLEPTPETSGFDAGLLASRANADLAEKQEIYDLIMVKLNLLFPLRIIEMKTGWQESLYQAKTGAGQSSTQVKLPIMIREKPSPEWIR